MSRLRLGALEVDSLTFLQALDGIDRLVVRGDGGSVFTPNVDHVVLAEQDPRFRAAYADVSLSLVDGVPLLVSARLLGRPLPEKISGSDLIEPLLERAAARDFGVYFLGGAPGSATLAAERMRRRFPNLRVVGTDCPRIDLRRPEEDEAVLARVREAAPQLLLVGLGAPKQEIWIHRCAARLAPAVSIAIGAGLDFLAGRVKRAPPWVSRAGLEWLYRLGQEPRRLAHRYLVRDPQFIPILVRELRRSRDSRT